MPRGFCLFCCMGLALYISGCPSPLSHGAVSSSLTSVRQGVGGRRFLRGLTREGGNLEHVILSDRIGANMRSREPAELQLPDEKAAMIVSPAPASWRGENGLELPSEGCRRLPRAGGARVDARDREPEVRIELVGHAEE